MPEQKRRQVVTLDDQYTALEKENEALKAENLKLRAQVNPLQRRVDSIEQRQQALEQAPLDSQAEKLLIAIANAEDATKEQQIQNFNLQKAKCDYLFDLLEKRNFIFLGSYAHDGEHWAATEKGRSYLASRDLL